MSIINYKYKECLNDRVIASQIKKFISVHTKINLMSESEINLVDQNGFNKSLPIICESKRKLASTVTDFIEPISNECVKDQRQRKRLKLNSLMILQTLLDFYCSMEENVFNDIYKHDTLSCYKSKENELNKCKRKSFKLVFFDNAPEKLFWIQLVTGKVCK